MLLCNIDSPSMGTNEARVPVTAVERRRRVYEFLDSVDPRRGRALRWCEQALVFYKTDGDMKEARLLLRSALDCAAVADYSTVYRAWIAMEADHEGTVRAARELFEEWGRRLAADRDGAGLHDVGFWFRFLAFEVQHGCAEHARAVAEAAVAACPGDPTVYAKYAKAEVRFGHKGRALAVVDRGLVAFAEDAGAQEWLLCEVRTYRDSMRTWSLGDSIGRLCLSVRRFRPPRGYQLLRA